MAQPPAPERASRGKLGRRALQLTAFGLFALGNPLYLVACSGASEGDGVYQYGREDMLAVASGLEVEGPYQVGEYSVSVRFPFDRERAANDAPDDPRAPSFFARAHACGTRSFVAPAGACIDSSELSLGATLRVERGADVVEREVTGIMRVDSRILTFAHFDFAADSHRFSFTWNDDEGYRYQPTSTNAPAALAALFAPETQ